MPRLRIHHLVEFEFREVYSWYAGHSPLAAEIFIRSFFNALEKVRHKPLACAPWRPPCRRVRLYRYPYLLVYHSDKRSTSVLALIHERRDPIISTDVVGKRLERFS